MKYLIDSNIFIYHLNGESWATSFLLDNQNYSAISQITYIEVLSFMRLVLAWVELRQEELLADWQLAQNGELPIYIAPLK